MHTAFGALGLMTFCLGQAVVFGSTLPVVDRMSDEVRKKATNAPGVHCVNGRVVVVGRSVGGGGSSTTIHRDPVLEHTRTPRY